MAWQDVEPTPWRVSGARIRTTSACVISGISTSRVAARSTPLVAALLMVLVAGCTSGPPATARPDTSAGRATESCHPDRTATAGRHTITVGGVRREYQVDLPAGSTTTKRAPMILALHGYGGSADELEAHTKLAEQGTEAGSIVVTPDALGSPRRWNFARHPDQPDDYAFIDALVGDLLARYCVDPGRVSVAGSSNGAAFAGLLACTEPHRFAAVAMVIATVPLSGCPATVSPAVLTVRGTADEHVPFPGTDAMVAGIAKRAGCDPAPTRSHPADDVDRTTYDGCRGGRRVVLDAIRDGGHEWPAPSAGGFDASAEIIRFFSEAPPAGWAPTR